MTHLVLVGMMGTGKTTAGKILAERLGRPFFDSDQLIESRTGRTVRQIFRDEGEAAYRVPRDAGAARQPRGNGAQRDRRSPAEWC